MSKLMCLTYVFTCLHIKIYPPQDGKQIKCDEPFSLFKPHDHEYGPVESAIHPDAHRVKRSDSVNGDDEESAASRPPKKSKQVVVPKEATEVSKEPSETDAAKEPVVEATVEKEEPMEVEQAPVQYDGDNAEEPNAPMEESAPTSIEHESSAPHSSVEHNH